MLRSSHYDGYSLPTSLETILRRPRQSSGSDTGEFRFSPKEGCAPVVHIQKCLKGFDKQAYLSHTFKNRFYWKLILHFIQKIKSHCSRKPCAPSTLTSLFLYPLCSHCSSVRCVCECLRASTVGLSDVCPMSHDLVCHCSFPVFATAFSVPCNIICCDC